MSLYPRTDTKSNNGLKTKQKQGNNDAYLPARALDDFVSLTRGGPVGVESEERGEEEEEEEAVVKVWVGLRGEEGEEVVGSMVYN